MTYKQFLAGLLWLVRIVTLGLTLFLFLWLFNKYFAPLGKLEFKYDFSEDSFYISKLFPWQRLTPAEEMNGDWFQSMKDDLVYFKVKTPRWFQTVTAEITFQNKEHPVFEIGARINSEEGYFERPLENKVIDDLGWNRIAEENTILLQRNKKYETIRDFITNLPQEGNIGEYFYKLPKKKIIKEYQKSNKELAINRTLRGKHTIFTYLKEENLNFTISKSDLNWYSGPDQLTVEVFKETTGEKVFNGAIPDDGVEAITGSSLPPQILEVNVPNLEEGVYRIDLKGNDDTLISKIVTAQNKLVFAHKLFLADNEEYFDNFVPGSKPSAVYAGASKVQFKTSHESGLQKIQVGEKEVVDLQAINRYFRVFDLSGITRINIPKNDVLAESDGYFAFSKDQYFYPYPENIIALRSDTDINSLDYIIADYHPPRTENGWSIKSQTFDLTKLYKDKEGRIQFRLSAPGLGEKERAIAISGIKVTFKKPPITIRNFPERLKNFIIKVIRNI